MNKNDQAFAVQHIRAQYVEKQSTDSEGLKRLDAKVKRPATVLAYVFGSVAALVMGMGMSLCMTELALILGWHHIAALIVGILLGVIGGCLVGLAYPVYNAVIKYMRKKHGPEILRLTDELMK